MPLDLIVPEIPLLLDHDFVHPFYRNKLVDENELGVHRPFKMIEEIFS